MININPLLYSKEILRYINFLVNEEGEPATNWYDLDSTHKDELIALGMQALRNDVEIILNCDANHLLAKYLKNYDPESKFDLLEAIKASAYEQFECDFDAMIKDAFEERENEIRRSHGLHSVIDRINGELTWKL